MKKKIIHIKHDKKLAKKIHTKVTFNVVKHIAGAKIRAELLDKPKLKKHK